MTQKPFKFIRPLIGGKSKTKKREKMCMCLLAKEHREP